MLPSILVSFYLVVCCVAGDVQAAYRLLLRRRSYELHRCVLLRDLVVCCVLGDVQAVLLRAGAQLHGVHQHPDRHQRRALPRHHPPHEDQELDDAQQVYTVLALLSQA